MVGLADPVPCQRGAGLSSASARLEAGEPRLFAGAAENTGRIRLPDQLAVRPALALLGALAESTVWYALFYNITLFSGYGVDQPSGFRPRGVIHGLCLLSSRTAAYL